MPLEFSVLIGLVAIVVCVLKGRYWSALGIFASSQLNSVSLADLDLLVRPHKSALEIALSRRH